MAWAVAGLSLALGTLLATRILKPYDRPSWLLALHRHLAGLFLALTATHLASLLLDSYVAFHWQDLVVPMHSVWRPHAVTYGVLALHIALVVQASSLARRWVPRRLWHGIHMSSYLSFALVTVHAVLAGSDVRTTAFLVLSVVLVLVFVMMLALKALTLKTPRKRQVLPSS